MSTFVPQLDIHRLTLYVSILMTRYGQRLRFNHLIFCLSHSHMTNRPSGFIKVLFFAEKSVCDIDLNNFSISDG